MRFWVPEETVRINKVRLSYRVEPFRSYERAIEAAPATTSGPSTRQTTAAGGQTTSGPSSRTTTAAGGQTTSGPSSRTTTAAGGQTTSGPSSKMTTEQTSTFNTTEHGFLFPSPIFQPGQFMSTEGLHNHGIPPGTQLMTAGGGAVTFMPSGDHYHQIGTHYHEFWGEEHTHGMDHTHEIAPHVHEMDHTHEIAPHVHEMDHTHEIAPHVHEMDHTHTIPAHTHDIEYGIFEGPTPTAVTVRVDGNVIPGLGTSADEVDIIPYLSKDDGGRIRRGTWHTIEIAPNSLGRIVATVLTQIFVQSRGGGNY